MNEEKNKKATIIRAILCVVVIIIVILGWLKIIPQLAGIVFASAALCVISIWNGIEAFKSEHKRAAVFNFIMTAIILLLCAQVLINHFS